MPSYQYQCDVVRLLGIATQIGPNNNGIPARVQAEAIYVRQAVGIVLRALLRLAQRWLRLDLHPDACVLLCENSARADEKKKQNYPETLEVVYNLLLASRAKRQNNQTTGVSFVQNNSDNQEWKKLEIHLFRRCSSLSSAKGPPTHHVGCCSV